MGYRLSIIDIAEPNYYFYGTKLYGYVDSEKLTSKAFLKEIYPDYDLDASMWEGDPCFILTAEQFRQFIALYSEDWFTHYKTPIEEYDGWHKVIEMLERDSLKEVSWY